MLLPYLTPEAFMRAGTGFIRGVPRTFAMLLLIINAPLMYSQESKSLTSLASGKTDKADIHGFTEIYGLLFEPIRSTAHKVCEIGIEYGGSLQAWSEYFSNATIYGIDIYTLDELRSLAQSRGVKQLFLPSQPEINKIKTYVADQSNRNQLNGFIKKYGSDFDLILDDGGHSMKQQQVGLGVMFKHVKPGGFYVIEDVHTSLPNRYEGYDAQKSEENTTLTMINYFIRHEKVKSLYMTQGRDGVSQWHY